MPKIATFTREHTIFNTNRETIPYLYFLFIIAVYI